VVRQAHHSFAPPSASTGCILGHHADQLLQSRSHTSASHCAVGDCGVGQTSHCSVETSQDERPRSVAHLQHRLERLGRLGKVAEAKDGKWRRRSSVGGAGRDGGGLLSLQAQGCGEMR
jgi:hypothetical protein